MASGRLNRRLQDEVPVEDLPVISLEEDRARLGLVRIQSASGDSRNPLPDDDGLPVEDDGDEAADEHDAGALPLPAGSAAFSTGVI